MPTPRVRPVAGRAVLELEAGHPGGTSTLLLADLHLGLGSAEEHRGGPWEGSADRMRESLVDTARATGARRLLIVGDVKHPIVGTPPWLRPVVFGFFAGLLEQGLQVDVVLGNHDVGLVPHLPKEVGVFPATGVVRDGVGCFHGHRRPAPEVLDAPLLVVGHLHPGFRLAPTPESPTGKQRCWLWTELSPPGAARPRSRAKRPGRTQRIVVLPAFNPLSGTEALNRGRPARFRTFLVDRFLVGGETRAVLLDGTDLGRLTWAAPSSRRRAGSAPATPPE
ncbi:MAG: metallophosphoesterase [Thermoplasmata archaeon]|nr:metallophosphoesterase [Thermoplasmata archaeon]